nr:MAG TPA: hypothetical protein [Bacteriophage sp.]
MSDINLLLNNSISFFCYSGVILCVYRGFSGLFVIVG